MVKIDFINDINAPYGFSIEPKDKSNYERTTYSIHLDTLYVKMSLWIDDMCISYLFDKNRKYIPWKQREKEIKSMNKETKVLLDGYKILRKREFILSCDDYYETASECFYDSLYYKVKIENTKRYYELTPIETIYEEHTNYKKQRKEWDDKRKNNEEKYLNSITSKKERLEILDEELGYLVGILAYHPMLRDSDRLINLANYSEYEKRYFSKVENKNENYIEYLKVYCYKLRDSCIDDIEVEKELEFIKEKCKDAKLLDSFHEYYNH